jgi:hypothetical protein
MLLNNRFILFLLLVCCNGCIEPFQPVIRESSGLLVIEGRLTDTPVAQSVTISRSVAYSHPEFKPVSGCVVRVEDETGEGITYSEQAEGVYQATPLPGFAEAGKAFKLVVFTPEGEIYESEYDSLLACSTLEDVYYREEVLGTSDPRVNHHGVRFYVDVSGSNTTSRYYLWNFEETWEYHSTYRIQYILDGEQFVDHSPELHGYNICYLTNRIGEFQAGSSTMMEKNELREQPLYFVSNQTPRLRHTYSLLVLQYSLSLNAYDYWERMGKQAGGTGGLFETQPSGTRGNIYNTSDPEEKVLGFFFASQVKQQRVTISERFQFPIVEFNCPTDTAESLADFGVDYPYLMYSLSIFGLGPPFAYSYRECHDCRYRGGVTTRPDFLDQ